MERAAMPTRAPNGGPTTARALGPDNNAPDQAEVGDVETPGHAYVAMARTALKAHADHQPRVSLQSRDSAISLNGTDAADALGQPKLSSIFEGEDFVPRETVSPGTQARTSQVASGVADAPQVVTGGAAASAPLESPPNPTTVPDPLAASDVQPTNACANASAASATAGSPGQAVDASGASTAFPSGQAVDASVIDSCPQPLGSAPAITDQLRQLEQQSHRATTSLASGPTHHLRCKRHDDIHDIFISYRVGEDSAVAQRLADYFELTGQRTFLDAKCLPDGQDWKLNFLHALGSNIKKVVIVLSAEGVARFGRDHPRSCLIETDNFLYEIQVCLQRWQRGEVDLCIMMIGTPQFTGGDLHEKPLERPPGMELTVAEIWDQLKKIQFVTVDTTVRRNEFARLLLGADTMSRLYNSGSHHLRADLGDPVPEPAPPSCAKHAHLLRHDLLLVFAHRDPSALHAAEAIAAAADGLIPLTPHCSLSQAEQAVKDPIAAYRSAALLCPAAIIVVTPAAVDAIRLAAFGKSDFVLHAQIAFASVLSEDPDSRAEKKQIHRQVYTTYVGCTPSDLEGIRAGVADTYHCHPAAPCGRQDKLADLISNMLEVGVAHQILLPGCAANVEGVKLHDVTEFLRAARERKPTL
eukprot:m.249544 g.249544  ORF g.249544 m.249544 type:complete len:640 (-) comp16196_c0_seq1:418-2337(-)